MIKMASDESMMRSFALPVTIPARDVLKHTTLKAIGMMLNVGVITNWKDVAGKLGKSPVEINGCYSLKRDAGDPAYSVITDWMMNSRGTISQLCQVFEELGLISCLDEVEKDIEDYLAKSQTKMATENSTVHGPHATCRSPPSKGSSLSENSDVPSSLDEPPEFPPCSPSELSEEHSLQGAASEETITLSECSVGEGMSCNSNKHMTAELESSCELAGNVNGKVFTKQNDSSNCTDVLDCEVVPSKSQPEAASLPTTSLENDGEIEPVVIDSEPSSCQPFFRNLSCPEVIQRPSPPLSPPRQHHSKGKRLKELFFKRSVSVDESKQRKKYGLFSRKHSKKHKQSNKTMEPGADQSGNSERNTYPGITVGDVHVEAAEEQVTDYSPMRTTRTGQVSSNPGDDYRRVRSISDQNQTSPVSQHRRESGYTSDETNHHSSGLRKVNTPKRLFVLCHNEKREFAEMVYAFFNKPGYECHFYAMDVDAMVEQGRYINIRDHICKASFVLICLSPKLKELFEDVYTVILDDEARAIRSASDLMVGDIGFHCKNPNGKYMPVLSSQEAMEYVPFSLQSAFKYNWSKDKDTMISVIHGKPQVSLSKVKKEKYVPKSKQVPSYRT